MSDFGVDLGKVGQRAVGRLDERRILELELLGDVGDPAFAKDSHAIMVTGRGPSIDHSRHFDRAGIGGRDNAVSDNPPGTSSTARVSSIARLSLPLPPLARCERARKSIFEGLEGPAGALGTGAGGEVRGNRAHAGRRRGHNLSFQIAASRWERCPTRGTKARSSAPSSSFARHAPKCERRAACRRAPPVS